LYAACRVFLWNYFRHAACTIAAVRRNRRIDPKSFDMTSECPECHYKIPPSEMMRLGLGKMRCPNCKREVIEPVKNSSNDGEAHR
jgi:hypothetical protein